MRIVLTVFFFVLFAILGAIAAGALVFAMMQFMYFISEGGLGLSSGAANVFGRVFFFFAHPWFPVAVFLISGYVGARWYRNRI